ncbi:MAG: signal peptidase II [Deltaproteobacteria bacterium]|nr:signal peptidase II [Deltaproteobacteria bacterium]
MSPRLRIFLTSSVLAVVSDQASKIWVDGHVGYADRISVIEGFFYITHVRNPGAAFSTFLGLDPTLRLAFFIAVSLAAIGIIVSFYRKLAPGDRLSSLALGLILGGAVGNLIDRITRGEVVDFLHFRLWTGYSWPDFNFADSFIVIGVALLVLELLASEGENRSASGAPPRAPREEDSLSSSGSSSPPV